MAVLVVTLFIMCFNLIEKEAVGFSTGYASSSTTGPPMACPFDFIQLGGQCYYFNTEKKETWFEALDFCQSIGTTLAHPTNANDNLMIVDYLRQNFNGTSATDETEEGVWVWAHDNSPVAYTDWKWGQPSDDERAENCLEMWDKYDWKWNDVACNSLNSFICQRQPQPFTIAMTTEAVSTETYASDDQIS